MSYFLVPHRPRNLWRYRPIGFNGGRRMPVDVQVIDDAYLIKAEVPGLKAEDLEVEILDDVVTLKGSIEESSESNDGEQLIRELSSGSFQRSLRLPDPVEADSAEAQRENGLLTVRIPKTEEARPKTIKVKGR